MLACASASLGTPALLQGVQAATIVGTAFIDADRSGDRSSGESGVAKVLVTVENSAGVVASTTTGAKGEYSLEVTTAGPYRVRFSGWSPTLTPGPRGKADITPVQFLAEAGGEANLALVDVAECAVAVERVLCPAQIGDRVWVDLDGDGLQDGGEPGIPGVKITVRSSAGVVETGTDSSGAWFVEIPPLDALTVEVALDQKVHGALRPTKIHASTDDIDSDGALDPAGKVAIVAVPGMAAGQAALSSADFGFAVDAKLTILTEVLDPGPSATWLDGDDVVGSLGKNDGVRPMFAPNEPGEFRVTLQNAGRADIVGIDVRDTICAPAVSKTLNLAVSESIVLRCTAPKLTAPALQQFTASGGQPIALPGGEGFTALLAPPLGRVAEEAGVTVASAAFEIVEEVQDPANALAWLDADPVAGPLGASGVQSADHFAGETASFRVRIRNIGNITLDNILVTDPDCGLSQTLSGFAPGATRTLTCSRSALTSTFTAAATASGATATVHENAIVGPLSAQKERAAVRVFRTAISLLKEAQDPATGAWLDADSQAGSPGSNDGRAPLIPYLSTAKYRLTVGNTGTSDLVNVSVGDPWCSLATIIPSLPAGDVRQLTCDVARMTADRVNTATARATARIPGPDGRTSVSPTPIVSEEALVRVLPAPTAPGTSTTANLPGATAVGTPGATGSPVGSGPVAVITGGPARMKAGKTGPGKAVAGRTAVYEITVHVMNSSAVPARGVRVRELLPPGMTVLAKQEAGREPWRHQRQRSVWTIGDVAAGETRVLRVLVKIDPSLASAVVSNRAEITAENATRIVVGSKPTRIVPSRRAVAAKVTG